MFFRFPNWERCGIAEYGSCKHRDYYLVSRVDFFFVETALLMPVLTHRTSMLSAH